MISREEALRKADQWVNGGVPSEERRDVGIYEFDSGYVVWPVEPEPEDPTQMPETVGGSRGVIDKQTGALTTWPSLSARMIAEEYSAQRQHG